MDEILEMRRAAGIVTPPLTKMTFAFAPPIAKVMEDACEEEGINRTEFLRRLICWYAGTPTAYEQFWLNATEAMGQGAALAYEAAKEQHPGIARPVVTRQQAATFIAENVADMIAARSDAVTQRSVDDRTAIRPSRRAKSAARRVTEMDTGAKPPTVDGRTDEQELKGDRTVKTPDMATAR